MSTSRATLGAGSDTERGALGGEWGRGTGGTNGHCRQPYTQAQAKQGRRLDPGQEHGSSTPAMVRRRHTAVASVPCKAPVMLQGQARNKQVRATSEGESGNVGGLGTSERGEEPTHKRTSLWGVRTAAPWIPGRSPKGKRQN